MRKLKKFTFSPSSSIAFKGSFSSSGTIAKSSFISSFLEFVSLLFYGLDELVTDGLHAVDGRMSVLFLDVMELDQLHAEVLADLAE